MIPVIEQTRMEGGAHGVFGVWRINKELFCNTLELPWKMNAQNVSCIPPGPYLIKRITSPAHGETFRVQKVYGRSFINIHSATFKRELKGCIAIGESVKKLRKDKEERILSNSGKTFKEFMKIMEGYDTAKLIIKEDF